jgi:hypothetical protein
VTSRVPGARAAYWAVSCPKSLEEERNDKKKETMYVYINFLCLCLRVGGYVVSFCPLNLFLLYINRVVASSFMGIYKRRGKRTKKSQ